MSGGAHNHGRASTSEVDGRVPVRLVPHSCQKKSNRFQAIYGIFLCAQNKFIMAWDGSIGNVPFLGRLRLPERQL